MIGPVIIKINDKFEYQTLIPEHSSCLLFTYYSRHSVNGPLVNGNIQLRDF